MHFASGRAGSGRARSCYSGKTWPNRWWVKPFSALERSVLWTVSSAPGANLWWVEPFSALERSAPWTVSSAPGANLWWVKPFSALEPSAPRLALTYGEFNPLTPFRGFPKKNFSIKKIFRVFWSAKNRIRIFDFERWASFGAPQFRPLKFCPPTSFASLVLSPPVSSPLFGPVSPPG